MSNSSKWQTVLIVHPGTLGDVLLSLPAVRMLRQAFASHEIVLMVQPRIGRLLQSCGEVDQTWSIDGSVLSALYCDNPTVRTPIREVLSRTTHVVGWFQDTDKRLANTFRNLGVQQVLLISPKANTLQSRHMSERYMETLKPWGGHFSRQMIPFSPLKVKGRQYADSQFEDVGYANKKKIVLIHPGSGSPHKCLPPEVLGRLVQAVARDPEIRVLICEGPNDRDCVKRLLCKTDDKSYGILREKTLEEMSHFLVHADLFLGHDSGLTHLAAALGLPTVVLFGPTDPEQWCPLGEHVVVEKGPACRCQTWTQVQDCPEKVCVTHSVEELVRVVKKQLDQVTRTQAKQTTPTTDAGSVPLLARDQKAMLDSHPASP